MKAPLLRFARILFLAVLTAGCILPGRAVFGRQTPATSPAAPATQPKAAVPSASEIAAAKASHKVWVNLNTGLYHKGGRWYGKTKDGKFMTPDEAKKAGYKAAKRD